MSFIQGQLDGLIYFTPITHSRFPGRLRAIVSNNTCQLSNPDDPVALDIVERHIHPNYNPTTLVADIAIAVVERDMLEYPKVMALPVYGKKLPIGEGLRAHGFNWDFLMAPDSQLYYYGWTHVTDPKNCTIHYGPMYQREHMSCFEMWSKYDRVSHPSMEEYQGCEVGIGVTLIFNGDVAGIVTFAAGCLFRNWPGVFQETYHFKEWIDDILARDKT